MSLPDSLTADMARRLLEEYWYAPFDQAMLTMVIGYNDLSIKGYPLHDLLRALFPADVFNKALSKRSQQSLISPE